MNGKENKWSKDEEKYLLTSNLSYKEIGEHLGRTEKSVSGHAIYLAKKNNASQYTSEKDIVCPFFIGNEARGIQCEGVCGKYNSVRFNSVEECVMHKFKYCRKFDYEKCPMAIAIGNIKYGGKL